MSGTERASTRRPLVYIFVIVLLAAVAGVFLFQLLQTAALSTGEFTAVELEPGNETVDEQETVDVSATIQNTGDVTETQRVELSVGDYLTRESITLEPGEIETIHLRGIEAGTLGLGNTTYYVSTDDHERSATLVVESDRPPVFEVTQLEPDEIAVSGDERAHVSAEIENTGGTTGSQTVDLRFDNETYFEETLEIDPGESETFETYVDLGWLPLGEHSFSVHTANDSANGTVTILERGNLELSDVEFEPEGPYASNETFNVSMTVENNGNIDTNGTVELEVDEEVIRTRAVQLDEGAETTVVFEDVDAGQFGVGQHSYQLSVDQSAETGTLVVEGEEPANLVITSFSPGDTEVESGGSFDVFATVENTGEQTANDTVEVWIERDQRVTTSVEVPPGESRNVTVFGISVSELDSGEYEYRLVTDSDEVTATLVVRD